MSSYSQFVARSSADAYSDRSSSNTKLPFVFPKPLLFKAFQSLLDMGLLALVYRNVSSGSASFFQPSNHSLNQLMGKPEAAGSRMADADGVSTTPMFITEAEDDAGGTQWESGSFASSIVAINSFES